MNRTTPRRRTSFATVLLAAVTIATALITLVGLAPLPFLPDGLKVSIGGTSQILVQLVTITGALAVIVGVFNLLGVHLRKIRRRSGAFYSLITILTLLTIVVLHALERFGVLKVGLSAGSAPDTPLLTLKLMDTLQVTIESALSGLLFFFLVYSAYRLMRRRVTIWGLLFVATLILVLIGYTQPPGTLLYSIREWILNVPVIAGTRGLLIGIAIGTVIIGARVLIGQDRLFRE